MQAPYFIKNKLSEFDADEIRASLSVDQTRTRTRNPHSLQGGERQQQAVTENTGYVINWRQRNEKGLGTTWRRQAGGSAQSRAAGRCLRDLRGQAG